MARKPTLMDALAVPENARKLNAAISSLAAESAALLRARGCHGPSADPAKPCGLRIKARGLCWGHYQQQRRDPSAALRPIRAPDAPALERVSLRVSPATRRAVLSDPEGARAALDGWAAPAAKPPAKTVTERCAQCLGSGRTKPTEVCDVCEGRGVVRRRVLP